jgi:hypothetical protein
LLIDVSTCIVYEAHFEEENAMRRVQSQFPAVLQVPFTLLLVAWGLSSSSAARAQASVTSHRVIETDVSHPTTAFTTGSRLVGLSWSVSNLPASSTFRFRYQRPDGSIALDVSASPGNPAYPSSSWWYVWWVTLDVPGTWKLLLEVNGSTKVSAPFTVTNTAKVTSYSLFADQSLTPVTRFARGPQLVGITWTMNDLPARSTFRFRYQKPDGSVAADYTTSPGNEYLAGSGWGYMWGVDLASIGTWHLMLDVNGRTLVAAPFEVTLEPVSVYVQNSDPALLFGSAQSDINVPLNATLALHNPLKLWLGVAGVSSEGRATVRLSEAGSPASQVLGKLGLIGPGVPTLYDATFPVIDDAVTVRANLTPMAVTFTLLDVVLNVARAADPKFPVGPLSEYAARLNDIADLVSQVSALTKAANALFPLPKSWAGWLWAAADIASALTQWSPADKVLLQKIFSTLTHGEFTDIKVFDKALARANRIVVLKNLMHVLQDALIVTIAKQGADFQVRFVASPIKQN